MSIIMLAGLTATIILLIVATYFYAKYLEQDAAQEDFGSLRNDMHGLKYMMQQLKDSSIQTSDLELEINRDIDYADRLHRMYVSSGHRNGRISWYIGIAAFVVLMLSIMVEAYLDHSVKEAYQKGALEAIQKAGQVVQEAIGDVQ